MFATAAPDRGRAQLGPLVTIGCLIVLLVALPFALQQSAITQIDARIEKLRPGVAEASMLRRRLDDLAGNDASSHAFAQEGHALQSIAMLTAILPDDTWITRLSLHHAKLTFDGQSANAARLIGALGMDRHFPNPSFTAPVNRSVNGKGDMFSIETGVRP